MKSYVKNVQTSIVNHRLKYPVVVEPEEIDGGFVAHCPELKGCWSQGESVEEALHNIEDAIAGWLAAYEESAASISGQTAPAAQPQGLNRKPCQT